MKTEYQAYQSKSILERADKSTLYRCSYKISPYVGCELGCVYCPSGAKSPGQQKVLSDTSRIIKIKANAPLILKKELKHTKKGLICICRYQQAEKEHRLIRRLLEVMSARSYPVHVITKSDKVLLDLDLLAKFKEKFCAVTFRANTMNEDIAKMFEPKAPSPIKRLEALREVHDKGIITGLALDPIIPYITDTFEHLEEIVRKAAENNASYILAKPLILHDECRTAVIKVIKRHFPELLPKYKALYEFGSAPDYIYAKKLKLRTSALIHKFDLEEELPYQYADDRKKQVSIEDFMVKRT